MGIEDMKGEIKIAYAEQEGKLMTISQVTGKAVHVSR
jgi:hypothetical protein